MRPGWSTVSLHTASASTFIPATGSNGVSRSLDWRFWYLAWAPLPVRDHCYGDLTLLRPSVAFFNLFFLLCELIPSTAVPKGLRTHVPTNSVLGDRVVVSLRKYGFKETCSDAVFRAFLSLPKYLFYQVEEMTSLRLT